MTDMLIFEPFVPTEYVANGAATIHFSGFGIHGAVGRGALAFTGSGRAPARGAAVLRFIGFGQHGAVGRGVLPLFIGGGAGYTLTPDVNLGYGVFTITPSASGHQENHAVVDGPAPRLYARTAYSQRAGIGFLSFVGEGILQQPPIVNYLFAQQSPGYAYIVGLPAEAGVVGDANATDAAYSLLTIQTLDKGQSSDTSATKLTGTSTAIEVIVANDAPDILFMLLAAAGATASDDVAAYLELLLAASDVAFASGAFTSQLDANLAIAALAVLSDRADPIINLSVADALAALDTAALARVVLLAAAMDAAVVTDLADGAARFSAFVADAGLLADSSISSLTALSEALDAGLASTTIHIGTDVYAVYAMTLQGAAVTEYAGIAFNSYVRIHNKLYGAAATGLYLCEGATDDGAPINASVRIGFSALGTQLLKSVPNAYVGYTSDGTLLLKVSTTDKGVKRTNVYKVNAVQKSAVSDNRFSISKGMHSVYWDFEPANYNGSDFELETIKVWRLALNRRK